MSSKTNIMWLIGAMMLIMLPIETRSQEQSLENILIRDIQRFGEMAAHDNVITEEHRNKIESYAKAAVRRRCKSKARKMGLHRSATNGSCI